MAPEEFPDEILDSFDIIGFDPRGIGRSHPIQCDDTLMTKNFTPPATQTAWNELVAHNRRLGECCRQVAADPTGYHAWTAQTFHPFFDAQVAADRASEQRLAHGSPPTDVRAAAQAACAFGDPVVMRARARVRHLLSTADDAYGSDEAHERVTAWMAARPDFTPQPDGPTRDQWDALIPS
ncbi:hypothetical protein [Microtetraspora malaysiensis]|uniref:hypothetical protein n=1 Tax=Microtetraspora malaysiensis TaxID=161358 RepID=UPI00083631B6|nr:hypothetical protein [Microtetraspora malaysiensis]